MCRSIRVRQRQSVSSPASRWPPTEAPALGCRSPLDVRSTRRGDEVVVLDVDTTKVVFRALGGDGVVAMDALGKCLLVGRLLILLQAGTVYVHREGACAETELLAPHASSFGILLARIEVDMVQVCVFSLLPVRRAFIYMLCSIESAAQLVRLCACRAHMHLGPQHNLFLVAVGWLALPTYLIIAASPAHMLEHTLTASFRHKQRLQEAAREQRELVNMLCTDLKIPVQQTRQLWTDPRLSRLLMDGARARARAGASAGPSPQSSSTKLAQRSEGSLAAITLVVGTVLFLLRVHEGRFQFSCDHQVHLPAVGEDVLRCLLHCLEGLS